MRSRKIPRVNLIFTYFKSRARKCDILVSDLHRTTLRVQHPIASNPKDFHRRRRSRKFERWRGRTSCGGQSPDSTAPDSAANASKYVICNIIFQPLTMLYLKRFTTVSRTHNKCRLSLQLNHQLRMCLVQSTCLQMLVHVEEFLARETVQRQFS